jgi:hypothetical protein
LNVSVSGRSSHRARSGSCKRSDSGTLSTACYTSDGRTNTGPSNNHAGRSFSFAGRRLVKILRLNVVLMTLYSK